MTKQRKASRSMPEEFELRITVKREALLSAFDQATREGRSSLEVIRERIEKPLLLQEKARLEDYSNSPSGVRPKNSHHSLWTMTAEKLVTLLPLAVKCQLLRIVRENGITQQQFGFAIVQAAINDEVWLRAALASAAAAKAATDELDREFRSRYRGR